MNKRYRVTPRAFGDLRNIGRYSAATWGKSQRDRYLREIDRRFAWLADNPRLGTHRPDINEGYFCFPQGSHLVFYLIREDGIDIIGIPHKEMDILNYFDAD
ncbi:MAG: type II toxin-antitoxin system RelE/ParE family toxin [Rhodospirillaceae bacterium]|mgnify:CR=1 FL=1|jgi:toxin ParE1/3/4|nr:type II toxin-antitoxin system RelE/ParE family toxin [Rhodospirillaceae bacterium]MBT4489526.1 type II toxin-antitoxin system RelE/ParE family toxin [Rhodospirillaceae bacterium]MBT5190736.1 type II toxin-antitoxin system RelE/ParE family toxin [Rhodospirillaceae bacterium]MBT5897539.1 type II toxin-antitoxin system RelE/ParE family toxin [Rhodospirillaceae bacterium]MBT6428535.1 type II toxin-antitoxin system RelE/ParE family toxin [Rhodospirillaceae bacterium]